MYDDTIYIHFWFSRTDTDTEVNFIILRVTDTLKIVWAACHLSPHGCIFIFFETLGRTTHKPIFLFFFLEFVGPVFHSPYMVLLCFLVCVTCHSKAYINPLTIKNFAHMLNSLYPIHSTRNVQPPSIDFNLCDFETPRSRQPNDPSHYTPRDSLHYGSSVPWFPNKFTT